MFVYDSLLGILQTKCFVWFWPDPAEGIPAVSQSCCEPSCSLGLRVLKIHQDVNGSCVSMQEMLAARTSFFSQHINTPHRKLLA
ncbi:Apoptosis-Resistant E3 Ubiquitin Protein Ligase 1 [Manis pentadactyla]|nr:Apoptosis-Resistant E3 Ubiquitin Protein Ligase 1 [Manis pentadactyla]